MNLEGVAAIVTGGASGLGQATAQRFAKEGAKVAIFDLDTSAGEALAQEVGGIFAKVDVTKPEDVSNALSAAAAVHGEARILVNCAGIVAGARVVGPDGLPANLADFARVIEINLIGTFNVLAQFAARLLKMEPLGEERGVIVNTASVAAFDGKIGQAAYSASKSAVAGMTLPIAREFAKHAVRIVSIAPGIFGTPMLTTLPQAAQDRLGKPLFPARPGYPDEFARLVRDIVGNPMLNGETIRLDGAIRLEP
ncbi:SDR family NAD(P)-dependent oxidoreductase [Rhizobium sp. NZLR11]|uniref:SDR family NAD(P)-dependent oxidoreductase n=1 Tax=Rhizobium sp. NZLR11 TaxID=2731098 RepID=UPI001C8319F0|nr:SDR family NAD(P)-dependent oxidoreductase [Rhizobium sp. NZLR11]MBX5210466.1 SDR family NAD(P)-dependent oxidoreductase [Rhizobium sp. NZLR11]